MIDQHSRPFPNNIGAERDLCASLLLTPRVLDDILSEVSANDFYDPTFGKWFAEASSLILSGCAIDRTNIVTHLHKVGIIDQLGGIDKYARIIADAITGHELYNAREIRRTAMLRRQIMAAAEIADKAYLMNSPSDVRALVEQKFSGIDETEPATIKSVHEIGVEVVDELKREIATSNMRGIRSGLTCLDSKAGAFMPGELILLAARTGIGKTSLATQFGCAAAERGNRVLLVSVEMTGTEVVKRILAAEAEVDSYQMRSGQVGEKSLEQIESAVEAMRNTPMFVWSPAAATIEQIYAMAKLHRARGGLDFLIVDYIGRIKATDPRRERHEQVSHISWVLKTIAVDLNIPVLALAQLNRDADGSVPKLSQLRDSGSLEQDADVVLFLHRESVMVQIAELIVAKHRHGPTGTLPLWFDGKSTRYLDETMKRATDNRQSGFDEFNAGGVGGGGGELDF